MYEAKFNPLALQQMTMLKTQSLSFRYPNGPAFEFPDMKLESEKAILVLGKSGKGKTTLLHLLAGLLNPISGSVTVGNVNLASLSGRKRDEFRGQNIGLIFQEAQFVKSISVMQNLQLARTFSGLDTDVDFANQLLDELGIKDKGNSRPSQLSVGERQRAGIARALITRPKLVLADEPTSALDDDNCRSVAEILEKTVVGHGAALVVVTHDQRLKDRIKNSVEI